MAAQTQQTERNASASASGHRNSFRGRACHGINITTPPESKVKPPFQLSYGSIGPLQGPKRQPSLLTLCRKAAGASESCVSNRRAENGPRPSQMISPGYCRRRVGAHAFCFRADRCPPKSCPSVMTRGVTTSRSVVRPSIDSTGEFHVFENLFSCRLAPHGRCMRKSGDQRLRFDEANREPCDSGARET